MKVAIVGTMGVPARYGGFETLADNIIGDNASPEIEYTVFCSRKAYKEYPAKYKRAILKYVDIRANGIQSVLYDIICLMSCWFKGYDAVVILGISGCVFLPLFRILYHNKLIVNIDGLEHRRKKWGRIARKFLLISERMAVRYADVIIADNKGIQDYVTETYHKPSSLVAYGGDHVIKDVAMDEQLQILKKYGLETGNYAFAVCRIEPENNCHHVLEAFAQSGRKLMFVGNFEHSDYARELRAKYEKCYNIMIQSAIYDLNILYALRNNCKWYIHGHSAGGTNPSLVEAMHIGCNILAFDSIYNQNTTQGKALFWNTQDELLELLNKELIDCGATMKAIAQQEYIWKHIAEQYETLY